tara:strand:- start:2 stop:733 length:732 start_codon:yes stop_codon:yes gene_type:complete
MAFNFRKYIPFAWKTKMPKDMNWEIHSLHAYKEKKEAFAKGEITLDQLREFEHAHREHEEQREFRWKQHHQNLELQNQIVSDYQNWKHYGANWLGRMMDKGRGLLISQWWWKKPKKPVGKGKMWQSSITGQWFQEHKPDKTMNIRDWLQAANTGNAFKGKKNFNPDILKLDKPTEDMIIKSNDAKKERAKQHWDLLMTATNNFGKGWHTEDRTPPGTGGGLRSKRRRVTFSDPRVYGGRDKNK